MSAASARQKRLTLRRDRPSQSACGAFVLRRHRTASKRGDESKRRQRGGLPIACKSDLHYAIPIIMLADHANQRGSRFNAILRTTT